jgi:hypothetical protein
MASPDTTSGICPALTVGAGSPANVLANLPELCVKEPAVARDVLRRVADCLEGKTEAPAW